MKKVLVVAASVGSLALTACELLPNLMGAILVLLGVAPAPGFSDPSSSNYGRLGVAVAGETESGLAALVNAEEIEVETDGSDVTVEGVEEHEGHTKGSFVMLVDDSGSTELATAADCEGCPTDPTRQRVGAVQALSKELHEQAPEWRVSLMDFGGGATEGFEVSREIAPFTTDTEALVTAADSLGSYSGTPLWDSVYEVLGSLETDVKQNFQTANDPDVGRGIVVLSDGQDTESTKDVEAVIARAKEMGIAVHVVGLGGAADTGEVKPGFSATHIEALRRLADETGGYYGSVAQPDELPALFEKIAKSLVGGYQKVEVKMETPPESGAPVTGRVGLRGTGVKVPFRFLAP